MQMTHLEDHLSAKRWPPEWEGTKPSEEPHQQLVVPHTECKAMRKYRCRKCVSEPCKEYACVRR